MDPLPYEIIEAMIQCFGRSFHYKDRVEEFMRSAGVSRELAAKYKDQYKFVWARRVLSELSESEEGRLVQRRLVTNLYRLRDLPDPDVKDRNSGLQALRELKELAVKYQLVCEEERKSAEERLTAGKERVNLVEERAQRLESVRQKFNCAVMSADRQSAGYSLEEILAELFTLSEMEYRKSYRTQTEQIDGHFRFEGFDYLVEARWRKEPPTEQEVGGFKQKVDSKVESTRGLFISVAGFRPGVVSRFEVPGANIIFMSGEDLTDILEGRFDLRDALRLKTEKAAQEGRAFVPLREYL